MKPQEAKTPAARLQLRQSIDLMCDGSVKLGGISMKTSSGAAAQKIFYHRLPWRSQSPDRREKNAPSAD
ncbi:hypothetical protein [Mesorhizobium sp.]|uniref:hypothetical protein n=1 Tax=Mesorhizobium sp. TaxID=1871066 RepID=UPI000FE3C8D1|nr:hypothetical protein [Mesorhizobium sp.]RWN91725.1 MAG: hypothetical protein EOS06_33110 [Mesorhizobium sp.]